MSVKNNYKHTLAAGYISYITQAIVNNFTPLLFITFHNEWGITLSELAFISTYNFLVQLAADIVSAKYMSRIGVRRAIVFAHASAFAGLAGLGIFPYLLPSPKAGLLIAITLYATGGGLIEVLTSPIIENCPTKNKESHMSLLHSFYCWGQMLAILFSTLFFFIFGISNWRIMAFIWSVIPALNGIYFARVPIHIPLQTTEEGKNRILPLFRSRLFIILMIMMLCSGACELAISQWASAFTEESLGISKTAGDILGPCMFALLMGIARVIYAKYSEKLKLEKYILFCAVLCFVGYLITALSPIASLSLAGCGICGFAVGIMWPGTYSLGAKKMNNCTTTIFALFALAGDSGCSVGPFLLGNISQLFNNNLKAGILAASVFPLIMIIASVALIRCREKAEEK